jgi:aldose 1-epimerase
VWDAEPFETREQVGVSFRLVSPDGDQGYPGTVEVGVTYALDPDGELSIGFTAVTDAPTVINLANHVYVDLTAGGGALDHTLTLDAAQYLEIGEGTIPTGAVLPVAGTPFDFTTPVRIGDRLGEEDQQLTLAGGYDHCWVIEGSQGTLRRCAVVEGGGRTLTIETTQPGVQFYSGNSIHERIGRGGAAYGPRAGFCLETQHFPDAPNQPSFPSTRLDPGDTYDETTILRFGTR